MKMQDVLHLKMQQVIMNLILSWIPISPSDKQLVDTFEAFCQSVATHSVAQIEQTWEMASVPGEDHV